MVRPLDASLSDSQLRSVRACRSRVVAVRIALLSAKRMRLKAWCFVAAGLLPTAGSSLEGHHDLLCKVSGSGDLRRTLDFRRPAATAQNSVTPAFLLLRGPLFFSTSPTPDTSSSWSTGAAAAAAVAASGTLAKLCRRHCRQEEMWLGSPPSSPAGAQRHGMRACALLMSGFILPAAGGDNNTGDGNNDSPIRQAAASTTASGDGGGIALFLDMRTAVLPAAQTLKMLYDDLRRREEALGRTPDDPEWSLSRVPNPVGALMYAAEPPERATQELEALGGPGALPCFRFGGGGGGTDRDNNIVNVSSGDVVGVVLDPAGGAGGSGGNNDPAMEIIAAAQRNGCGNLVLLRGVRPSVWENRDIRTLLRIAASACAGAGKTLVVSVRSVGQLHDSALAALSASQTQVLGVRAATPEGGNGEGSSSPTMALLMEPLPELWEAGLLYL